VAKLRLEAPALGLHGLLALKLAVAWQMVVNQIGANGSFSTMVPPWVGDLDMVERCPLRRPWRLVLGIGDAVDRVLHVLGRQLTEAVAPLDALAQPEIYVASIGLLDRLHERGGPPAPGLAGLVDAERAEAGMLQRRLRQSADHPAGIQRLHVEVGADMQHLAVGGHTDLLSRQQSKGSGPRGRQ
jgi:hypothetical protein